MILGEWRFLASEAPCTPVAVPVRAAGKRRVTRDTNERYSIYYILRLNTSTHRHPLHAATLFNRCAPHLTHTLPLSAHAGRGGD